MSNTTLDTLKLASYYFQSLIGPANLLSAISCYKFHILKGLTKEHKSHNYLSFGRLFCQ